MLICGRLRIVAKIAHKDQGIIQVTLPDVESQETFADGIEGGEDVLLPDMKAVFGLHPFLLFPHIRPKLVELDQGDVEITEEPIVHAFAAFADFVNNAITVSR